MLSHSYSYTYLNASLHTKKCSVGGETATESHTSACGCKAPTVAVTGVSLSSVSIGLYTDNYRTLTATVSPSNATTKSVTWYSSNTNVATVDNTGKIHAIGLGTATITCRTDSGGKTATCSVEVVGKPNLTNYHAWVHNGVISVSADAEYSDTVYVWLVANSKRSFSASGSGVAFPAVGAGTYTVYFQAKNTDYDLYSDTVTRTVTVEEVEQPDTGETTIIKLNYSDFPMMGLLDSLVMCEQADGSIIAYCTYDNTRTESVVVDSSAKSSLHYRITYDLLSEESFATRIAKSAADYIVEQYPSITTGSDEYYALWLVGVERSQYGADFTIAVTNLLVGVAMVATVIYNYYVEAKAANMVAGQKTKLSGAAMQAEINAANQTAINSARQAQLSGGYYADDFTTTILKKGDYVYGMRDGQTAWYTTEEMVNRSGYSKVNMYEGLQAYVDPKHGYRDYIGKYKVKQDILVPTGIANANPQYGAGGYDQYFIGAFDDVLELISETPMN
jgi:hypothetical protein